MKKKSKGIVTLILDKVQRRGKYSEKELIEGLKNIDKDVILYIRKKNINTVWKLINRYNPGRYLEAADIIQEALEIVIENVSQDKFNKKSKLNTYFIGICRNIIRKTINKDKRVSLLYTSERTMEIDEYSDLNLTGSFSLSNEYDPKALLALTIEIIKTMDPICIKLMDLRFGLLGKSNKSVAFDERTGYTEIAKEMDMKEATARQKYHRCALKLWEELKRRTSALY